MQSPQPGVLVRDNCDFTVEQLPYKKSRQVLNRIIGVFAAAGGGDVGGIVQALNEDTQDFLTMAFAERTTYRYKDADGWNNPIRLYKPANHGSDPIDNLNQVFGGADGMANWLAWLVFCVELHYTPFFDEAIGQQKRLTEKSSDPEKSD